MVDRTRLEWATWIAAKDGIKVFAVRPGNKKPLSGWSWYASAAEDPAEVATFFKSNPDSNYGVWFGPNYVAIDLDIDLEKGKDGIKEFEALCEEHGDFFEDLKQRTLVVNTPSGGMHLYFKAPFPCGLANDFPGGIDVRGVNGYVVGPGSELPNGSYELVNSEAGIIDLPDWLQNYVREPGHKDPQNEVPLIDELDQPEDVEHALRWLEAREPAIADGTGEPHTLETCYFLRDFGLSEEKSLWTLNQGWNQRCEPMWPDDELMGKIQNAWNYPQNRPGCKSPTYSVRLYKRAAKHHGKHVAALRAGRGKPRPQPSFQRTDNGKLCRNFHNALEAVEHLDVTPEHCEFTRRAVVELGDGRRVPLDETAGRLIRQEILSTWGLELSKDHVFEALETLALRKTFHPVREYFESLSWDGIERLNSWLSDYFGVERNDYTSAVGRKWLLGGAARIFKPGCKFDTMLVFVGGQGASKSKALRTLALRDDWFTDAMPERLEPDNKDAVLTLQGHLIVEFSEVASTRRGQRDTVKGFISRQVDEARPPYGRTVNEFPRQCILAGSTNESSFLEDPTGARRYWPVEIPNGHQIDVDGLREVREQLWAEAVAAYKSGEAVELPEELWPVAAVMQEHHHIADPWEDRLRDYVDGEGKGVAPTAPLDRVHTSTLLNAALGIATERQAVNHGRRLRPIMENRLGWVYRPSLRIDDVVRGGYMRQGAEL